MEKSMKSEVKITTFKNGGASITIDGKDISQRVQSLDFQAGSKGDFPVLALMYGCYEQATIEGEMEVVHVCPMKAR